MCACVHVMGIQFTATYSYVHKAQVCYSTVYLSLSHSLLFSITSLSLSLSFFHLSLCFTLSLSLSLLALSVAVFRISFTPSPLSCCLHVSLFVSVLSKPLSVFLRLSCSLSPPHVSVSLFLLHALKPNTPLCPSLPCLCLNRPPSAQFSFPTGAETDFR